MEDKLSQPHALIVDDNNKNLSVLSRLLSKQGISCTEVMNPIHLDDILQNLSQVDIAFIDLELPEVTGYEILEKLKSDARFHSIPMVAYTVHVSEITVAHQQGFDSFLGKPLDADRFPDQLAKILRGEAVWSA
jgi:two-component system, cell cycle response regulator DivK